MIYCSAFLFPDLRKQKWGKAMPFRNPNPAVKSAPCSTCMPPHSSLNPPYIFHYFTPRRCRYCCPPNIFDRLLCSCSRRSPQTVPGMTCVEPAPVSAAKEGKGAKSVSCTNVDGTSWRSASAALQTTGRNVDVIINVVLVRRGAHVDINVLGCGSTGPTGGWSATLTTWIDRARCPLSCIWLRMRPSPLRQGRGGLGAA